MRDEKHFYRMFSFLNTKEKIKNKIRKVLQQIIQGSEVKFPFQDKNLMDLHNILNIFPIYQTFF